MNKDLIKKSGFTLSEILITLGVIGVVAAITMPIIHSKIQWTILKNWYKKVYNTIHKQFSLSKMTIIYISVIGMITDRLLLMNAIYFLMN